MAAPKSGKHKQYAHYAVALFGNGAERHRLREYRAVQREMAAERIRLADLVLQPPKPTK